MSGTSVPLGTLQMTFRAAKAPELQLIAAAHTCNAQVVAINGGRVLNQCFLSANHSGNSEAHHVMQSLSALWRKSAPTSSGTP